MFKLLDLYCKAGGAAMGYHRAGFEIVGVDIESQPRYPFEFVKADALDYLFKHGHKYTAIHASPPCQAYSVSTFEWRSKGREYVDLISQTRILLNNLSAVSIIENVVGAPLVNPVLLCGSMFQELRVYRHRLFESSVPLAVPIHSKHAVKQARVGRPPEEGEFCNPVGHFPNLSYHAQAMGIDWMNKAELAQAIPPAYTEWIGRQVLARLTSQDGQ